MKVLVITTSRADWNGLGMVAQALVKRGAEVWVAQAAGHLAEAAIKEDGFSPVTYGPAVVEVNSPVNMLIDRAGSSLMDLATTIDVFRPDMALIVGDRHEALFAVVACVMKGVPVAHIAGGDVSGGSQDENWRHAISKVANVHFPTNHDSAARLIKMGEPSESIYMLGSPSIDRLAATALLSRAEALEEIGLSRSTGSFLLVNWQAEQPDTGALTAMLAALKAAPRPTVIIRGNADPGSDAVHMSMVVAAADLPTAVYRVNLRPALYLSLMKHCVCLVGNSSSGFYEAPFFGTPVVNIGDRQLGRGPKPGCMRNVHASPKAIEKAIMESVAAGKWPPEYPFGKGGAADRIAQTILSYQGRTNYRKQFNG
jgi:UDP-hydrolysing UDP-N-acetyl-D-glucosamine 2-epimerase